MPKRFLMICLLGGMVVTQPGCRPSIARKALQKGLRKFFSRGAKRAVPKAGKGAPKVLPGAAKGAVSQRMALILSRSQGVGKRLIELRPKIPPALYARLWSDWQQTDAELQSFHRQLESPNLSPDRRGRLERKAEAAEERLNEIERLTKEWG